MEKICKICRVSFPESEEFLVYAARQYEPNKGQRAPINLCKVCNRARAKNNRDANLERARERDRLRGQTPKRKADTRERYDNWRAKNPEAFRAIQARYHKLKPEASRAKSAVRRGRVVAANGVICKADILAQLAKQERRCFYCDVCLSAGYEVDHYVPLAKGGSNWPENIVLACAFCNRSKGVSMPSDFIRKLANKKPS